MDKHLFQSPPVVQHASGQGFTISIEVNQLCTGCIEWGFAAEELSHTAVAAQRGLVDAHPHCLTIPVRFLERAPTGAKIFYRVVGQPLAYETAYELTRPASETTAVRHLTIPHADQESLTIAVVNDTHERTEIVAELAARIEDLDPDVLVWNGDACRSFDRVETMGALLLRPGALGPTPSDGGWASRRPLLYVPGNHDVRGEAARALSSFFVPGPDPRLPYNVALRLGPLALITLDSGEDKPDHHPVFAGTAAYEPYRELQSQWLENQLRRPEIADAPFKLAFSHIPLRGLPDQNDGSTLEGHARYSGQGAALWLPQLIEAGVQAVISGHTHQWRCDDPTAEQTITQIVGGGPSPESAALIVVQANDAGLSIRIENLAGETVVSTSLQLPEGVSV